MLDDTIAAQQYLNTISNQNIVIAWNDNYRHGDFINGWLTYFARNNQIWLTNKLVGPVDLQKPLVYPDSFPKNFLLLTKYSPLMHNTLIPYKLQYTMILFSIKLK